jgi:homoserine dehydrogenase
MACAPVRRALHCYHGWMQDVNVGLVGLGTVGGGSLDILTQNADQIAAKLGFRLKVAAVCSLDAMERTLPAGTFATTDWHELVARPELDIICELIGGTSVARQIIDAAIANGKSVVTANKELIGQHGVAIYQAAAAKGVTLAMEPSVCGGIPIHSVLREGIAADRIETIFGILNGTSNYILTEIEKHGSAFETVLAEAQSLGFAEANPSADVDGFDARSKLVLLAALAFGVRIAPGDVPTEGIRRVSPIDFRYAKQLGYTIRLLCTARRDDGGLFLSVRPSLVPQETVLASVRGVYNGVWCRGQFGQDTFYYGKGAGAHPTGVAVVSDIMRLARDLRHGAIARVSPFSFSQITDAKPRDIGEHKSDWYLRFRVVDRPGIIAAISKILADHDISIDAVLQLSDQDWRSLPFVITTTATIESNLRHALAHMMEFDFMAEEPFAMPLERGL